MLTVGDRLPEFKLKACVSLEKGKEFKDITHASYPKKWLVLFFWPKDFTFVCPTEIAEFGKMNKDFKARDAQVLGASTDSEFVHLAWRQNHADLKDLPFAMLEQAADIKLLHVPYRGGGPALTAFIGSQVDVTAQGLVLRERAPGISVEAIRQATEARLHIPEQVPEMRLN